MRWVIKEVEPPPHDSAAEDRSAEMRLGSVTAAILRYDLVASPHVCLPDFSPVAVGIRSIASCHSRHSPTHSGDGGGSFGDLFRRLIKPLFGYLLFVRFNELFLSSNLDSI